MANMDITGDKIIKVVVNFQKNGENFNNLNVENENVEGF